MLFSRIPSFLLARLDVSIWFAGGPGTNPFVNLGGFEFPEPPDLMRLHALAFDPLVNRVRIDAQVPGNFFD